MSVTCHHCNTDTQLVGGDEIYPHRADLFHLRFWKCPHCGAYVGCHREGAVVDGVRSDGTMALGKPANARERAMRSMVHAVFDPIWKGGRMNRHQAYFLLAGLMGLSKKECHIGQFSVEQCQLAIKYCNHISESLK